MEYATSAVKAPKEIAPSGRENKLSATKKSVDPQYPTIKAIRKFRYWLRSLGEDASVYPCQSFLKAAAATSVKNINSEEM